eukprot:GHVO01040279.1.p1 GENE.GHVO01040279.1~~GHVO01040279.1.p1  ORF type:complete len:228 (-),score=54.73 GHVO01040279.1:9-692(-)
MQNIRAHETSEKHLECQARALKNMAAADRRKKQDEAEIHKEIQRIEHAAEVAMGLKVVRKTDYVALGLETKGADSVTFPPPPPPDTIENNIWMKGRDQFLEKQMKKGRGKVLSMAELGEIEKRSEATAAAKRNVQEDWESFMDPTSGVAIRTNKVTGETEWETAQTPIAPTAPPYLPSDTFQQAMGGYYFGTGEKGLGYYLDTTITPPPPPLIRGKQKGPRRALGVL